MAPSAECSLLSSVYQRYVEVIFFSCLTFSETVNQTCKTLLTSMFLHPLRACEKLRNPVCKIFSKIHGTRRVGLSK